MRLMIGVLIIAAAYVFVAGMCVSAKRGDKSIGRAFNESEDGEVEKAS